MRNSSLTRAPPEKLVGPIKKAILAYWDRQYRLESNLLVICSAFCRIIFINSTIIILPRFDEFVELITKLIGRVSVIRLPQNDQILDIQDKKGLS